MLYQRHAAAGEEYYAGQRPGHWVASEAGAPELPPTAREWRLGLRWRFCGIVR
jgi:hypothetical protein